MRIPGVLHRHAFANGAGRVLQEDLWENGIHQYLLSGHLPTRAVQEGQEDCEPRHQQPLMMLAELVSTKLVMPAVLELPDILVGCLVSESPAACVKWETGLCILVGHRPFQSLRSQLT